MKLTILGTGNAAVTECYNTCFLLTEGPGHLLVDGGGGNGIFRQCEGRRGALAGRALHLRHPQASGPHHRHFVDDADDLAGHGPGPVRGGGHDLLSQRGDRPSAHHGGAAAERKGDPLSGRAPSSGDGGRRREPAPSGPKGRVFRHPLHPGGPVRLFHHPARRRQTDLLRRRALSMEGAPLCPGQPLAAPRGLLPCKPGGCVQALSKAPLHRGGDAPAGSLEELGVENLILYHTEARNIARRKALYTAEGAPLFSGRLFVPEDLETFEL